MEQLSWVMPGLSPQSVLDGALCSWRSRSDPLTRPITKCWEPCGALWLQLHRSLAMLAQMLPVPQQPSTRRHWW